MNVSRDDKKLDGAGLATLWALVKQYVSDYSSIPIATDEVLGGVMVGSTLSITNQGVLNLPNIVTAGTYRSVVVDVYGRVTGGTNPTTLSGYGITDAKIENGIITLGGNSITPLTSHQSLAGYATESFVLSQGFITSSALSPYLKTAGGDMTGELRFSTDTAEIITYNAQNVTFNDDVMTLHVGGVGKIYALTGEANSFSAPAGMVLRLMHGLSIVDNIGDVSGFVDANNGKLCMRSAVGVGTASPSYPLHVIGDCAATSFVNTSDVRKKTMLGDISIDVNVIAQAPSFRFTWKDGMLDGKVHVGTSAQYWQSIVPEVISYARDAMGTLSMQYDVLALLSSISIAKEVIDLREKVRILETRVSDLEKELPN